MPEEGVARPKLSLARKLAYTAVVIAALLAIAEIGLRSSGRKPFVRERADIRVDPGGRLFQPDAVLGYKHLPGAFTITLGDGYIFNATNEPDTFRRTHPHPPDPAKPEIWIFGDSITYGWSVNDDDTFAWRIQSEHPGYEVVNFGVNGYGTIHSLLQLREALAEGRMPVMVVVTYASFHDQRNTLTRGRRRALVAWEGLGPLNQPYGRIGSNGELEVLSGNSELSEMPLERFSSLVAMFSTRYDDLEDRLSGGHDLSKVIIREIAKMLNQRNIPLVIATLTSDAETTDMQTFCADNGILAVDMYVDYSQPGMNNLPYDGHPNATTHKLYAEKLGNVLRQILSSDAREVLR